MEYISTENSSRVSNKPYIIDADTLNNMRLQNQIDMEECRRVTESSNRGESYYANDGHPGNEKISDWRVAFFKEILYRDVKTDGFIMSYPHGNIITQGERNSYYRGENQVHNRSVPSLQRNLERLKNEDERTIYRFISIMRMNEFRFFIDQFDIVQKWREINLDVLYELLAQHYGLETQWMDITSDLEVALFFATCQWDHKNKCWRPLTRREVESYKYGVIFHIPGHCANLNTMMTYNSQLEFHHNHNVILPVGYQPFMRCHSQHAYAIYMEQPFPLQEDSHFEKLHFQHSMQLSEEIFHKMNEGKLIYPQEGLNDFDDIINQIRNTTIFSKKAFYCALEQSDDFKDENEFQKALCNTKLFNKPVVISDNEQIIKVFRQRLRRFNRKYENFDIEKTYGIKLTSRPAFYH